MSTERHSKIKSLLQSVPNGTVCLAGWLESIGISGNLQKRYKHSGWLASIGTGAFIRSDDKVEWPGGIYAIQKQAYLGIHPGGLTALSLQGAAHYIRLGDETIYLFAEPRTGLPKWFKLHNWGQHYEFVRTGFLPEGVGLTLLEEKAFSIEISTPERAILECLYTAPKFVDLVECYQIMEGLISLRPELLQELLEKCTSIKVTRLFLYMADKANHRWLKYLDKTKFNMGTGDRSIVKNGVYAANYGIVIPKELAGL
jgi:hypothetical protein